MEHTFTIFDAEADGLLGSATTVHCLVLQHYSSGKLGEKTALKNGAGIRAQLAAAIGAGHWLVGHNLVRYDLPLLRKLLGTDLPVDRCVDTLALSWHLCPERASHGLAAWGAELGTAKPEVGDWQGMGADTYVDRCSADVDITAKLFRLLFNKLHAVYGGDVEGMLGLCTHLSRKMDCLREQEEVGICLDAEGCRASLAEMEAAFGDKTLALAHAMPRELGRVLHARPARPFRKDGKLSATGKRWMERTAEAGLDFSATEIREAPNPASTHQLKLWLEGLGWEPLTLKPSKATGGMVPQVSLPMGGGICPSVMDLYGKEPALRELEGYYVLRHRMGLMKSFLNCGAEGRVVATAHGLANTLRLMHAKPVANLPKPGVPYGREVRQVLVAPQGHLMCGADVAALEDSTKRHYIWPHDPAYVEEMSGEGFDPHLDIGLLAGLVTPEEVALYKAWPSLASPTETERSAYQKVKAARAKAKAANFAATYGAGAETIAKTAKIPTEEGAKLHRTYWERNWAVKKVAELCQTKKVAGENWLLNPVAKVWVRYRDDKDRFSALNQSTGAYAFDTWVNECRKELAPMGVPIIMQYHDEILLTCTPEMRETVDQTLRKAMQNALGALKLNVKLGISTEWGTDYAQCH